MTDITTRIATADASSITRVDVHCVQIAIGPLARWRSTHFPHGAGRCVHRRQRFLTDGGVTAPYFFGVLAPR